MRIKYLLSIMAAIGFMTSLLCNASAQEDTPESIKENFKSVARRLDMYGDLLVVANAEDALEELFGQIRSSVKAAGGANSVEALATLDKVESFLKKNGFYAINGFGISAVPRGDGLHNSSSFISRDEEASKLPLWKGLVGGGQKELRCHAFLPSDTVFVRSSTADLKEIWKMVNSGIMEIGTEETIQGFNKSMQMMPMVIGMPIDKLMEGIGDEGFISIQQSRTKTINLPVGGMSSGEGVAIKEPSFLFALEIVGDSIPELLKSRLGTPQNPMETIVTSGITVFVSPMPLPAPIPVKPSFAVKDNILLLGSSPDVLKKALRADSTKVGLFTSPEFKKLFGDLPKKNNGMTYMSKRFSDTMMKLQPNPMKPPRRHGMSRGAPSQAVVLNIIQAFQKTQAGQSGVTVTLNWKAGVQTKGVSTVSGRDTVVSMSIAPVGLLTAISIPAFVQHRTDTRKGLCDNNMRLIQHAKGVWAIKNSMVAGDAVEEDDVSVYIDGGMPMCPQGGVYDIGAIDHPVKCSVHSRKNY
ncbi:hypothetical protein BVX94_01150 [bacterium B17]|nr:hypothetical protein BVX94_01150 [bacterium B17]